MSWGDSHAGSLAPALQVSGFDNGVSGYVFSAGSTLPILSVERYTSEVNDQHYKDSDVIRFDERQFNDGVFVYTKKQYQKCLSCRCMVALYQRKRRFID